MAWEQEGRSRYYYRSRLIDGRVEKQYVGHGPQAELVAQQDALARADRLAEQQAHKGLRSTVAGVFEQLQQFMDVCDLITRVSLLAAGYHQHDRGAWRRRRVRRGP